MSAHKRRRGIHLHVMVTDDEFDTIHQRIAEAGIANTGAHIRKMALNGYILNVDLLLSGNLFPYNAGARIISIRLPFMPIPTVFTRPRLQPCKKIMRSCGVEYPMFSNSLRRWWSYNGSGERWHHASAPRFLLYQFDCCSDIVNVLLSKIRQSHKQFL